MNVFQEYELKKFDNQTKCKLNLRITQEIKCKIF